jgi:hypothetical protein
LFGGEKETDLPEVELRLVLIRVCSSGGDCIEGSEDAVRSESGAHRRSEEVDDELAEQLGNRLANGAALEVHGFELIEGSEATLTAPKLASKAAF